MKLQNFILVLCVIILVGCDSKAIAISCPISDLLISQSDLPSGTIENLTIAPMPDAPEISSGRDFSFKNDMAFQEIYGYPALVYASRKYTKEKENFYKNNEYDSTIERPDFKFSSNVADEMEYACGKVFNGKIECKFIARYGNYYTFFRLFIGNGFTESNFQDALKSIDQKFSQCLNFVTN